jgi:cell division protease FtsH
VNKEPEERTKGQKSGTGPSRAELLIWLFFVFLAVSLLSRWGGGDEGQVISYSAFRTHLASGEVAEVTVRGDRISGELRVPPEEDAEEAEDEAGQAFITYLPSFGDDELLAMLDRQGVEIRTEPDRSTPWGLILMAGLPLLLIIGFWFLISSQMRQRGEQFLSLSRTRAKARIHNRENTTFEDVAGADGAKMELQEVVAFLKEPERFRRLGAKPPKGVLLVGPPGTGKTLMARAVAGEAGVPFFSITGSDFMEMFVGVGASRVRDLFRQARESAPSIVFIDELDSIGRRRGAGVGGGHDEREQTLNQLLAEMDGFEPQKGVIVLASTNRPDILDPALLRPGRFDRQVLIDAPTSGARLDILRIHARDKRMGPDVDLREVARGTPGFSGADLANLLNEAALLAGRKDKDAVEREDIEQARDKILLGLEREGMALTEDERQLLAYHEAGHAVLAAVLPNAEPIHKVTIVPRGRSMGSTQQLPERDRYIYSREYLLDRLAVILGGRAAEDLMLGTMTTGAEDDLKQVTRLARKMVLEWGMSERLAHMALGNGGEHVFLGAEITQPQRDYSETTAREVDNEVRSIVNEAYQTASATLTEHADGLRRLAAALLEEEEVPAPRILDILGISRREAEPAHH